MTTDSKTAVWIDAGYDQDRASDGQSRYGAYVHRNMAGFAECWDGTFEASLPVRFAATAWRVATGPVMVPGYVRYHSRVMAVELAHNYFDGSLLATVNLTMPWPQALRQSRQWMRETGHDRWDDWRVELDDSYSAPTDEDVVKTPFLLTSGSLQFTVPDSQLPPPPSGSPDLAEVVTAAKQSVAVAVDELNRVVWPIIQCIEQS